jgi:hypothetical protein
MKKSLLSRILGRVWDETAPAVSQGSSELASVMYTGSAFVHPRPIETMAQLQAEAQQKQTPERGDRGLEMDNR